MQNNCTIVHVDEDGRHNRYTDKSDRSFFSEDYAKRIAWTLSRDYPGFEFHVLEHDRNNPAESAVRDRGEFLESFLVGDDRWTPVGVVEFPEENWIS